MKKLISLLYVFVLFSLSSQAQNIVGKVIVEKDKTPVQFASVGLVQLPDSAIVSGSITLTDGGYIFEKVKPGNYFVKVSYVGYKTGIKNVVINGNNDVKVDTIYLAESVNNLDEVTVTGERLKGTELVDRTVYSIPAAVAKTSSNGYDLLKKIPQVNVDFQNNVTLNGSTNFIIQVDGKQRDKEFLAKLLPEDIEKIEIISNPSGRYEGNIDGVLSIILKKEARYGMNGNVGFYLKPVNKVTAIGNGSLDYAMGKITFYVTAFTFSQHLNMNPYNYNKYLYSDSISDMFGAGKFSIGTSSVNTGFDYYMNDKNNLSFNISFKPVQQSTGMDDETYLYKSDINRNDSMVNFLRTNNNTSLESQEGNASLFYKKTFTKAIQEFSAETNYYIFKSKDKNNYTNFTFTPDNFLRLDSFNRFENNINNRSYFSTKINYVHPIGLSTKLEAGYQFYYQDLSYDFNTNNFDYGELRNSAYAGITFNVKKIGFQTNLRVENSHITSDSITSPNYSCFLPSANIQYKFTPTHNIKFTYNRRINRPGIYDMNPYQKISSTNIISTGNPNLKPEYRDRFQITYTWNFGSNYFSPNVYYEILSNKIGTSNYIVKSPIDGKATLFTRPYNLLTGNEYGGGVNAMLWFVNINARIFQGHFNENNSQAIPIPARDYFSYSINGYAFAPLAKDKKTTAFAFFSYNGVNINAQSKTYNVPFYGLGGQKIVGNHTIGIFYLLPFSNNINFNKTITETNAVYSRNIIGIDIGYYVQIMYSYKFSKGKNVKKLNRKVEVESDSKNDGIGK